MSILLLNDLHLGCHRQGGTTPQSREALRTYQFSQLRFTLSQSDADALCFVGDLFDEFEIAPRDWLECYGILCEWLNRGRRLILIAGNHDVSSKGLRLSSFSMLASVLVEQFDSVKVLDIGTTGFVADGVFAIAHHANQELFDLALGSTLALSQPFHTLLLHCNLNNVFAQNSDHSLDLSSEWATKFEQRGVNILLAHEHNSRVVRNVTVLGCQFPTSISDCLGSPQKFAHALHDDGTLTPIETWDNESGKYGFSEIDWRELTPGGNCEQGFIRIVGDASSNEAGDVITAIAKFRSKSNAFVISNAVRIDGIVQSEELAASFEATAAFDVLAFIKEHVSAEEWAAIEELNKVTE